MKFKFNSIKTHQEAAFGLFGICIFLLIWQFLSFFINPIFISSPSAVLKETMNFFKSSDTYSNLLISLEELGLGFFLSIVIGVFFGFILGWYQKVNFMTKPLIYALYATPIIAIFPLIIIWFGIGLVPKVILIFLASFFPILITVGDAVKNIDKSYLRLAKSFGANEFKLLTTVALPYCFPNIFSSIRIAMPRAIIGMVLAEFFLGNSGLGYLISYFAATFQTAKFFSIILILIAITLFFNLVIDRVEKIFSFNNTK